MPGCSSNAGIARSISHAASAVGTATPGRGRIDANDAAITAPDAGFDIEHGAGHVVKARHDALRPGRRVVERLSVGCARQNVRAGGVVQGHIAWPAGNGAVAPAAQESGHVAPLVDVLTIVPFVEVRLAVGFGVGPDSENGSGVVALHLCLPLQCGYCDAIPTWTWTLCPAWGAGRGARSLFELCLQSASTREVCELGGGAQTMPAASLSIADAARTPLWSTQRAAFSRPWAVVRRRLRCHRHRHATPS